MTKTTFCYYKNILYYKKINMFSTNYFVVGVAETGGLLIVADLFPPGNDVIANFIMTNNGS